MPFAVYMLALAVFSQGTSEFMLSGLVPDIARDMGVSIPDAGLLTSAFAVGMMIGAPAMAALGVRWSRRAALTGFLVAFVGVHVLGALTTSFPLLVAGRVVAALAMAGFMATALATATAMAGPGATGRATSVVISGVTIACIAGVPAGALLGQLWGWRAAFWAVAIVSLPAVAAILWSIPAGRPGGVDAGLRSQLGALARPRLLVLLVLCALVNGATFCAFTYLAPLFTDVTGLAPGWVPALLALFGIGSFLGATIAGRVADRRPLPYLVGGGLALLLGWALFAATADLPGVTVPMVLVLGTLAFGTGSMLVAQVFTVAADAPALAGGVATAAFNVGAAAGPWLGGIAIAGGFGFRAPPAVAAAMVAGALVIAAVAHRRPAR